MLSRTKPAAIKFETEDGAARFEEGEHEYRGDVALEDGSVIGSHRFVERVAEIEGGFNLQFQLQVEHEGLTFPPTEVLENLIGAVWQTVQAIDLVAAGMLKGEP